MSLSRRWIALLGVPMVAGLVVVSTAGSSHAHDAVTLVDVVSETTFQPTTTTTMLAQGPIGSCSGLQLLGGVTPALPAAPTPVVVSVKTAKLGLSVYDANLDTPPISTTGAGACHVLGKLLTSVVAGAKLSGIASCDATSTNPSLYPLNGKLRLTYAGGSGALQAYIRHTTGYDPLRPDVINLTGIVTKGDGIGATINGSMFFDPVIKAGSGDPNGVPKYAYYFDRSQFSAPCASGGNSFAFVYMGDGESLIGSAADGISFSL